jgi:hypothetical protein
MCDRSNQQKQKKSKKPITRVTASFVKNDSNAKLLLEPKRRVA